MSRSVMIASSSCAILTPSTAVMSTPHFRRDLSVAAARVQTQGPRSAPGRVLVPGLLRDRSCTRAGTTDERGRRFGGHTMGNEGQLYAPVVQGEDGRLTVELVDGHPGGSDPE